MPSAPARKATPLRVAVLASGRGSNLESLLRHIARGLVDARVTLVVSDKPTAGAAAVAQRASVPTVVELMAEPGEKRADFDRRLLGVLQAEGPDLVVLAGYMRIVGKAIIDAFAGRIVNIHPSLLPSFRGLAAQQQTLAAGVRIAGCTTHIVTSDLDGGPILLQAAVAVRDGDTRNSLAARILRVEHLLLPRTVQLFAEGRVRITDGRARIAAGPSWLERDDVSLVAGVLYGEGF